MKERHLRLINFCEKKYAKKSSARTNFLTIKDFMDNLFLSKYEKIYILKDILIRLYKEYEETTGIMDIPYFVKAEKRICRIIKERKVDYYFNRLKRFRNDSSY